MRTVLRRLTIVVAVLALLLLAAGTFLRWHGQRRLASAAEQFEEQVGSVHFEALRRPPVEKPKNAAVWLQAGALATMLTTEELALLRSSLGEEASGWEESTRADLTRLLETNGPALELLHRAAGLTASNFDLDYERGPAMKIPNLLEQLNAGRLLLLEAKLALLNGDGATALDALASLRAAADAQLSESVLIFQLVGLAMERLLYDGLQLAVSTAVLTPSQLEPLVERSDDATELDLLRRGLSAEGAFLYWVARTRDSRLELGLANRTSLYWGGRLYAARALEYYTTAVELYPSAPYTVLVEDERLEARRGRNLIDSLRPELWGTLVRFTLNATVRQLAAATLAVWEQAEETGAYPESLPEAAGQLPLTGDPIGYEVRSDGTAVLTAPGAWEAVARFMNPNSSIEPRQLLTWELPSLPAPSDP